MLKRLARKVVSVLDARDYDRWHRQEDERALRTLRKHNGMQLTPAQRRMANAYAVDVLGSHRYAPWSAVSTHARIEWNGGHCDIKFSEATTGPCFTGLNWSRFHHA
jgi:hypothetical protein